MTDAPDVAGLGVVVHLAEDDVHRQRAVLRNVVNLRSALERSGAIEVVTHGPGLTLLTGETGLAADAAHLQGDGVSFRACENTMRSRDLTLDDLLEGVESVESGVAHLTRRQLQGWAYLRP